ncbi:Hypothetical protein NTJ_16233 [Nesidiocoris tenuis]|uniref:Uncharacterized protein n=1 Tax=Nesidiocoris tenuis TaxID=355587 RepID=A0ABN7BHD0_9HEMI|nr:Hypothetical protein NTJ_16233 [Nesidiocoris tenuis]
MTEKDELLTSRTKTGSQWAEHASRIFPSPGHLFTSRTAECRLNMELTASPQLLAGLGTYPRKDGQRSD